MLAVYTELVPSRLNIGGEAGDESLGESVCEKVRGAQDRQGVLGLAGAAER